MAVTINDSRMQGGGTTLNENITYEYKGLHTDQKPTDCGVNSLFLELDTGDFYYFNGTTWTKVGA